MLHQICHGCYKSAFVGACWFSDIRDGFGILGPHLLAGENQVDGTAGFRRHCVHQHVYSGDMAILQANRFHGLGDPLQVVPLDSDIHVASQAGGQRIDSIHMAENGEPADHLIANSGTRQRRVKTLHYIAKLIHFVLVVSVDEHRFLS